MNTQKDFEIVDSNKFQSVTTLSPLALAAFRWFQTSCPGHFKIKDVREYIAKTYGDEANEELENWSRGRVGI